MPRPTSICAAHTTDSFSSPIYMYMHKQQLLSQRPPSPRLVHQCPPCTPLALSVKTSVIFSQFRCVAVAWHENSMDWTRAHPQCYMRQRGVPRGGAGRKKCERVNYMASPILAGKRTTRQDKPIAGCAEAVDAVRVEVEAGEQQQHVEQGEEGRGAHSSACGPISV